MYDICVMGSGPAGQTVAVKMAKAGRRVVMIETRELGGTCALRGCNPKKVLTQAAVIADAHHGLARRGIVEASSPLDWASLHQFQNEFTDPVPGGVEEKLADLNIDVYRDPPRFVSPEEVKCGGATIRARKFVLATGAKPSPLNFPGHELVDTSDDFLNWAHLPPRVLFVGGGYVSTEFSFVVNRCGSSATVIQRGKRILPHFDPDLVDILTGYLRDRGVDIRTRTGIEKVERSGDALHVHLKPSDSDSGDRPKPIEVDRVVHGAGRVPNLDGLNLDAAGVETTRRGIRVENSGRCTGVEHIYAVGDCADSGLPPLTATAQTEGQRLVDHLIDGTDGPNDAQPVTIITFTPVPLASVGMTQAEAEASIEHLDVRYRDTSTWGTTRKTHQPCAGYKILVDRSGDRIVGAHFLGPGASEQVHLCTLAIRHGLTTTDLKRSTFGYPTFADDLHRMLG